MVRTRCDASVADSRHDRSADQYVRVMCFNAKQEVGETVCDNDKEMMAGQRRHSRAVLCESDEVENSDESSESRPSGERWAPVGANDGDNEFADEYKYVNANVEKYEALFSSSLLRIHVIKPRIIHSHNNICFRVT